MTIDYPELPPDYAWEDFSDGVSSYILLFFDPAGAQRENYAAVGLYQGQAQVRIWGHGKDIRYESQVNTIEEGLKIVAMRAWIGEWT